MFPSTDLFCVNHVELIHSANATPLAFNKVVGLPGGENQIIITLDTRHGFYTDLLPADDAGVINSAAEADARTLYTCVINAARDALKAWVPPTLDPVTTSARLNLLSANPWLAGAIWDAAETAFWDAKDKASIADDEAFLRNLPAYTRIAFNLRIDREISDLLAREGVVPPTDTL